MSMNWIRDTNADTNKNILYMNLCIWERQTLKLNERKTKAKLNERKTLEWIIQKMLTFGTQNLVMICSKENMLQIYKLLVFLSIYEYMYHE